MPGLWRRSVQRPLLKVDDPCGAISVHGYCGWLGAVCVGIFADGTYGSGWNGVGARPTWAARVRG
jgi:ammonia channel protein AmtB